MIYRPVWSRRYHSAVLCVEHIVTRNPAKRQTLRQSSARVSFKDSVGLYRKIRHRESPGDIFVRVSNLPATPRFHDSSWETMLPSLCITHLYARAWVGLTLGDFLAQWAGSSEISLIVSRRAILPTSLMKIAKVQNRYSNYPNKKDYPNVTLVLWTTELSASSCVDARSMIKILAVLLEKKQQLVTAPSIAKKVSFFPSPLATILFLPAVSFIASLRSEDPVRRLEIRIRLGLSSTCIRVWNYSRIKKPKILQISIFPASPLIYVCWQHQHDQPLPKII